MESPRRFGVSFPTNRGTNWRMNVAFSFRDLDTAQENLENDAKVTFDQQVEMNLQTWENVCRKIKVESNDEKLKSIFNRSKSGKV